MYIKLSVILGSLFLSSMLRAETCSRVAIVNFQEILVDTNSSQKGEGLRFYLEKDKTAESYLDLYQENSKIKWHNAALGSAGTGLILAGLLTSGNRNARQSLLIGGATMILVNFFISKTQENANEANLRRAVEEYNQRNLPRIYFESETSSFHQNSEPLGISLSKTWDF